MAKLPIPGGRAARAPATGRDAARHARAAVAAAERRGGAGQRQNGAGQRRDGGEGQAPVPPKRRGQRLHQPVLHQTPGGGGQADRVPAAADPGVAARGEGQRVREL
eukprot:scaffold25078_cov36-Phaeocystis_antarctica.AAC.2